MTNINGLKPLIDSATKSPLTSPPNLSSTDREMLESLKNTLGDFKPSLNLLSEIWDTLKSDILSRTENPKYPIGLKILDEVLWGVHKKELMVIGARTSQGKSAFSIFLASQLADAGNRVIYFSLEMSKEQILERLLTQILRINNLLLRQGKSKEEVVKREKVFLSWMDNAKLLIEDKYGYDFEKVVRIIELIRPDFVFIDYIQMISAKNYHSKLDAVEEYVRKLKELSNEFNFGGIIVSQVNRSGIDGAEMQHLKWAGVLEEHPDVVIMLKWDWSMEDPNRFIVDVKKQRHGELKNGLVIKFIPEYSMFMNT